MYRRTLRPKSTILTSNPYVSKYVPIERHISMNVPPSIRVIEAGMLASNKLSH